MLEKNVNLVHFENNRIEISFNDNLDKNFIKERDNLYKNYVGQPTRLIKLQNLTDYLGGAQIYAKMVSDANGGAHKIYNANN